MNRNRGISGTNLRWGINSEKIKDLGGRTELGSKVIRHQRNWGVKWSWGGKLKVIGRVCGVKLNCGCKV